MGVYTILLRFIGEKASLLILAKALTLAFAFPTAMFAYFKMHTYNIAQTLVPHCKFFENIHHILSIVDVHDNSLHCLMQSICCSPN